LGRNRTRDFRIFQCLYWLPGPARQLHSECLGKPPHLPGNDTEAYDDESAHPCGRAGAYKGISEAEFVDRNTKSDHHEARKKGKGTDTVQ
jgi:hypothetical protein